MYNLNEIFITRPRVALLTRRSRTKTLTINSSVRLFSTNCTFKCYNNTAYPSGVFTANFGTNASLLNFGIILFFPDTLRINHSEGVRAVPAINWRLLAKHSELYLEDIRPKLRIDEGVGQFTEALLEGMTKGYIQAYLDMYYLNESPGFRRHHNKHETMLCGYDSSKNTVSVPFWKKNGEFSMVDMPLTSIIMAFMSTKGWPAYYAFDAFDRSAGFCAAMRKPVFCISPKKDSITTLDVKLIARQLEDSLYSRCTYEEYIGDPLTNWREGAGVFGLAVYHALKDYIQNLKKGGLHFDFRASRAVWEHKIIMSERIIALKKQGCFIPESVANAYKTMSTIAMGMHFRIYDSYITGKTLTITAVLQSLDELYQMERASLPKLIDAILRS